MDRQLAFELLECALYINKEARRPKSTKDIVYDISQYINDNYAHDFYTETHQHRIFFPFLYDWVQEGN